MSLSHVLVSTAAIATLAAAAGSTAAAQSPPVTIQSCTILQAQRSPQRFWYPWGPVVDTRIPVVDGIRIVYANRAGLRANRVAFSVNYRQDVQHIVDVGTFAPNVTIDHTFGDFSGDAFLGSRPNSCVVQAVRFVNGSVWRAATR
jgi:hypothetical protein